VKGCESLKFIQVCGHNVMATYYCILTVLWKM